MYPKVSNSLISKILHFKKDYIQFSRKLCQNPYASQDLIHQTQKNSYQIFKIFQFSKQITLPKCISLTSNFTCHWLLVDGICGALYRCIMLYILIRNSNVISTKIPVFSLNKLPFITSQWEGLPWQLSGQWDKGKGKCFCNVKWDKINGRLFLLNKVSS